MNALVHVDKDVLDRFMRGTGLALTSEEFRNLHEHLRVCQTCCDRYQQARRDAGPDEPPLTQGQFDTILSVIHETAAGSVGAVPSVALRVAGAEVRKALGRSAESLDQEMGDNEAGPAPHGLRQRRQPWLGSRRARLLATLSLPVVAAAGWMVWMHGDGDQLPPYHASFAASPEFRKLSGSGQSSTFADFQVEQSHALPDGTDAAAGGVLEKSAPLLLKTGVPVRIVLQPKISVTERVEARGFWTQEGQVRPWAGAVVESSAKGSFLLNGAAESPFGPGDGELVVVVGPAGRIPRDVGPSQLRNPPSNWRVVRQLVRWR